jgi:lipopolysaccharide heptosyltransferase II
MKALPGINKILFITLSNIGDAILTLPVLDALIEKFPHAGITVIAGPRPKEIFENNPRIDKVIVFNKAVPLKEKIKLFRNLEKEGFDMVIDLRNSLFGALLPARYKTSPFKAFPPSISHMKDRHLFCAGMSGQVSERKGLYISRQDEEYVNNILKQNNIKPAEKILVISAGARSHIKRWPKEKYLGLVSLLIKELGFRIVLAGDREDAPINRYIADNLQYPVTDLTAKTNVSQLAALLKKAEMVITNDSAVLHLASYLNRPVVAIFGPTDETKYGPWSAVHSLVKRDIFCRPCRKAQCRFGSLECMSLIQVEDVLREVGSIIAEGIRPTVFSEKDDFKRILIVRTDRIGDVLLSTPVIEELRRAYPNAYIAMMTSPYAKEVVSGNPYLDEVIVYDKDKRQRSWRSSLKFSRNLKKKRFDAAIILHPTNRVHLVTFFAGIPKRVGLNRKLGFLLTDRIEHTKQLGEKHEIEYNLDILRYMGIEPKDNRLFMPIKPAEEKWAESIFRSENIKPADKVLAVHPGASCPSKVWPSQRFAQAADRLIDKYGFKVILISGPKDVKLTQDVISHMRHPAVNLAGKTSVSQLASVLKRCRLFISNDSGPVHIASALDVPVISIFGRNQKGLSPDRWAPLGKLAKALHKDVGCVECLAHNCVKDFICLKAITVEDVIQAADALLFSS